jgi:3-methyl-2-oxobutanoate hydroxymethyltransferase
MIVTKPVTVPWICSQKGQKKLTMLTAYDYPTAYYLDECGIDMLLVGDSVATVMYGEPNTLSVTLADIIRHTRAVARGAKRALVVGDMPFMSYQISLEQAVTHAGQLIKEGHAQAIKLEGGTEVAATIRAITRAGIPVMGHIGLTPQSINAIGSYRTHGKNPQERQYLLESAQAITEAGAFSVVLECVEESLATLITESIKIPTIGIGAGSHCDGQVLVTQDLLGFTVGKVPRFVNPVTSLKDPFQKGVREFIERTQTANSDNDTVSPPIPSQGLPMVPQTQKKDETQCT